MEDSCPHMNVLENDQPTGLKFPQLMGMVYRTDFEVSEDISRVVDITRWLDTQTDGVVSNPLDDIEQNQSINSDTSSISEFISLKMDFVNLLFDNSITNDSDIAVPNTLTRRTHGQQGQQEQQEHRQEHQERISSDEHDGNTLFELDSVDEMNQIDEEVINKIFTERVIHEIRYTLQQIQA